MKLPVPLFQTHLATGINVLGNKPQYAVSRDGRFLLNTAIESAERADRRVGELDEDAGAIACSVAQSLPGAEMASRSGVKPQVPRGDRRLPRRALAPRRASPGRDRLRRGTLHRAGRLRRLPDRLTAAGAVALRGGLRPARRRDAAQRPEGSRGVADLGVEGRDRRARQGLLRQARARQSDVPRAADDSVLPRRLGRAPNGRERGG